MDVGALRDANAQSGSPAFFTAVPSPTADREGDKATVPLQHGPKCGSGMGDTRN